MRLVFLLSLASLLQSCAPRPESERPAPEAHCEFGPTQSLGPLVNSQVFDGSPTVSPEETELFFTSGRDGQEDIFVATRSSKNAAWGQPANLGSLVNDPIEGDFSLRLSSDGNVLYFASSRSGGHGSADIYVTTRASRQQAWGRASNLGPVMNTDAFEAFPTPSPDGNTLYFNRSTVFDSQDSDIWVTARASRNDEWRTPQRLPAPINSDRAEFSPSISADGNTLYFASERGGVIEIWTATRAPAGEWGVPSRLGANINVPGSMTLAPFISSDQRSLYVMSARPDSTTGVACTPRTCFERVDLFVASRMCPEGTSG